MRSLMLSNLDSDISTPRYNFWRHIQMIWEIVTWSENLVSEIISLSDEITIGAVAESMNALTVR